MLHNMYPRIVIWIVQVLIRIVQVLRDDTISKKKNITSPKMDGRNNVRFYA
jgi:hypothetical protein